MKPLLCVSLVAALLAAGCAKQVEAPAPRPVSNQPLPLLQLSQVADAGGASPVPTSAPGASATAGSVAPAPPQAATGTVPLVRDFDQAMELRDYTEKVAGQWGEAVTRFRAKQGRLPVSPAELQQFQPKLASFPPPKGFQVQWDPQSGEINVARAAPSKPAR